MMVLLARFDATNTGATGDDLPIVAGRIGPDEPPTAAESIAAFVRREVESLQEKRTALHDPDSFQLCALNAVMEQRVRCAFSLMRACGEFADVYASDRIDRLRDDVKAYIEVARSEIQDHCRLLRLLLDSHAGDEYAVWCESFVQQFQNEVVKDESVLNSRPLSYRNTLVRELSQLCVRMMQDYSRLEKAIVDNRLSLPPATVGMSPT